VTTLLTTESARKSDLPVSDLFVVKPILNSLYDYPARHWELESGQPTNRIIDSRRIAEFITPITKPKKRKRSRQQEMVFNECAGLSTAEQQAGINELARESTPPRHGPPVRQTQSGKIAVKVINHLGDEVMKVFKVGKETIHGRYQANADR
jgi:hypothetical protein